MYVYVCIHTPLTPPYISPCHPTSSPYCTLSCHPNTVCRRWEGSHRVTTSRQHIYIYIYIYIYTYIYIYIYTWRMMCDLSAKSALLMYPQ